LNRLLADLRPGVPSLVSLSLEDPAPARAFGFATTFYPTVAVFFYVAFRFLAG
jgi:hypothetical protein